jgi:hypothetical protein
VRTSVGGEREAGGRFTVTGVAEEAVENGGEGQAKHGAEQEYGEKDLMERELLVQREDLHNERVDPRAAGAGG